MDYFVRTINCKARNLPFIIVV